MRKTINSVTYDTETALELAFNVGDCGDSTYFYQDKMFLFKTLKTGDFTYFIPMTKSEMTYEIAHATSPLQFEGIFSLFLE